MTVEQFTALMKSIKVDDLLTYSDMEPRYGRMHAVNTLQDVRVTEIYPPNIPISRQRLEQLYPEQEQNYLALSSMSIWRFVVEDASTVSPETSLQPKAHVLNIVYDFMDCGRQCLAVTGSYMPEAPSYTQVFATHGTAAFAPSDWTGF